MTKKSVFWKIYWGFVIAFVIALVIGAVVLSSWLSDFEAAQPKYVAEKVYDTYFKNFDAAAYVDICENSSKFETEEDLVAFLDEITADAELTYQRISSTDKDSYKYMVRAGDTKIATFMLTVDSEGDGKFKQYTAGDFQLFTASRSKAVVTAPKDYKVFINGIELDDSYITETDIKTQSWDHMPDGVSGILEDKYTVTGLLKEPTVTATDANGMEAVVNADGNKYHIALNSDDVLKNQFNDYVLEAVKKYATYMQYDSKVAVMGFNQIKKYFDPESDLYEDIRTVENMFVIAYSSYDFEDENTSEFVRYDDSTFSCRVSFTHILHRKGMDDYKDFLDLTIYLREVDGTYLIYDMSQN